MFKVSPRQISAALCLIVLSGLPLASLAQPVDQQNPQQLDTSPMLDLTQQPTAAPSATLPTTSPSTVPTTSPSTVPTTKPSVAATTSPSTVPTTKPSIAATTSPDATEPGEDLDSTGSTSTGGGADIPPDPNVLDSAIHTPIYTKPLGQAPAPLDAPSNTPENKRSPYSMLSIVLWICFLVAAAATGYFLYVRFSDKD